MGSGEAAAAALSPGLIGTTVVWDAAQKQLVFHTDSIGDHTTLSFLANTAARVAFVGWLFAPNAALRAVGAPVSADELVTAFAADARVRASVKRTSYTAFIAVRSADPDEAAVLHHRVTAGSGLTTDGSIYARAVGDLEALGVVPGMHLVLTGPATGPVASRLWRGLC